MGAKCWLAGGLAAVVLTGKPHSARLRLSAERLNELRKIHGAELEHWWQERFGHAFDAFTENQKLGTLSAPRTLQPSEIALLRQSKQEIARKVASSKCDDTAAGLWRS